LKRISAAKGIAVWLGALTMRAVCATLLVLAVISLVPGTAAFQSLTRWCWHAAVPFATNHVGFSGDSLGRAASAMPGLALAVSALSVLCAVWRAARAVRGLLSRSALAGGPLGSLIVGDRDVVIAAAGISKPEVIVSAGALATLDDEELAAGVAHERGHIARRHRYILIYAHLCAAVARFLPGTRHAAAQLAWHVERDADDYATARHDRFALASAICKAAQVRGRSAALAALSGEHGVIARLQLLTSDPSEPDRVLDRVATVLSLMLVTISVAFAVGIPNAAAAGYQKLDSHPVASRCPG